MKSKMLLLVVLALALPMAALADDETFVSNGGTFSGNSAGYTLSNATLTAFSGPAGSFYGSNLGTVSFSTAQLGSYSNVIFGGPIMPGGNITITGNGTDGLSGALLNGTFDQGGSWAMVELPDGTCQYTLIAAVSGTNGDGSGANGVVTFVIDTPYYFGGNTPQNGVSVTTVTVPEPAELSMLGAGLVGLLGAARRKLKAQA